MFFAVSFYSQCSTVLLGSAGIGASRRILGGLLTISERWVIMGGCTTHDVEYSEYIAGSVGMIIVHQLLMMATDAQGWPSMW